MRLCVFPNDPLKAYFEKGEIKERYYNPGNFFDEVHFISLTDDDVDDAKAQVLVGNARARVHKVGKIPIRERQKELDRVTGLVREINPAVIRAYNPLLGGWLAASSAKKLKIPLFLSLHTNYEYHKKLMMKSNLKKFFVLKYMEKFIEPFVLQNADKITIVFKIIEPYVIKNGGKKPEVLYNRINFKQFEDAKPIDSLPKPLVISVGNLIKEKNHECLIRAMKTLDAHCLIIGKGDQHDKIMDLIKNEKLQNKITIKESIPHSQIQDYYKSAAVFALAYDPNLEGLPIPVIEAMACGLPVVIPFPKQGYSDGLDGIAVFSERTPESFGKRIEALLSDAKYREEVSRKSKIKALDFDNAKIESREREIYEELLK
ncbi:MAG: glycosyltransferase [Candidatus Nitrosotenuis sp.]